MEYTDIVTHAYDMAIAGDYDFPAFSEQAKKDFDVIISHSEGSKGVYTVFVTLLAHKIHTPEDDMRRHQASWGDFSGRTIDTNYITPFLRDKGFPSMSETGWLTRSLEQPYPYTMDYEGRIKPQELKDAFLRAIGYVQCQGMDAEAVLVYIFEGLIRQRDSHNIELARPHSLSIAKIIDVLQQHFEYPYSTHGASRLPTLAIYAAYECMMENHYSRFDNKTLCPLESHTSADSQSGQIGDIQINDANGEAFEGVEIKHKIAITRDLVKISYGKFMSQPTDRYYLLTTADMTGANWKEINDEIETISRMHGCQVIVNGVYTSLKYYLRTINDPSEFMDHYVRLLQTDENVKYPLQVAWNEIISHI